MAKQTITEAEFFVMQVLWDAKKPLSSAEVLSRLPEKEWKYTTVSTLLTRLSEKGAVSFEKKGRLYFYQPIIEEGSYKMRQTRRFLSHIYNGSVGSLVATLFQNNALSEQERKELREILDAEDKPGGPNHV